MALGRARVFGGELCKWMGRDWDVGEEMVGFVEKSCDFLGEEEGGDDQVAIFAVGGELGGG